MAPSSNVQVDIANPATGAPWGTAALAGATDIESAVQAARRSFDTRDWANSSPTDRARVLHEAADYLEAYSEELAVGVTMESGCRLWFGRRSHVRTPIKHLRYYGDLVRTYEYDDTRRAGADTSIVTQEPAGVVAAITPWNGPLSSPMLKVAPALAAGCSVVLKSSEEAPLYAFAIADALHSAELPEGALSVVPADRLVGQQLVDHPEVDKIAFTGSTTAGKSFMRSSANRIARLTLELGGKSAAIILDDVNTSEVVKHLLPMALLVNGQACIAQTRILVPRTRTAEITEALSTALQALKVYDPLENRNYGRSYGKSKPEKRVLDYIALGSSECARKVTGDNGLKLSHELGNGWFVAPTLFDQVEDTMRIAQEEVFGSIMTVISYDNEDEAVAVANESKFGLSGSIWSLDEERALAMARKIRTGMVSINGSAQAYGSPFGGFKESGIGREMGPEGFETYLETKSIAVK